MKLMLILLSACVAIIATANTTRAQANAAPAEMRKLADDY